MTKKAPLPSHADRLSRNNFDLIRLCLAAFVCFSHAYTLSGREQLAWVAHVLSSTLAVRGFFVVSGFLIVMSYDRSSTLASYARKRVRRIYPAYLTVVLLSALGLWSVSSVSLLQYFSWTWVKYIASNLTFLNFIQGSLPGVFESHLNRAVNGSLWTLKIEAMFYLLVPIIVAGVRRFGALVLLSLIYISSVGFAALMTGMALRTGSAIYVELSNQLPAQLSYFSAGALLYYYVNILEHNINWIAISALLVMCLNQVYELPWIEPLALAILVVSAGLFLYVGNFGKYGDFSYGLYILHFPIIQLAIHFNVFGGQPWLYLLAVLAASGLSAAAMWHLVEKRFLDRAGHYRAVAERRSP